MLAAENTLMQWMTMLTFLALCVGARAAEGDRPTGGKKIESDLLVLAPYTERYDPGATARFSATIAEGFRLAFCALTRPDGEVVYLRSARVDGSKAELEFPLDAGAGRYQVEFIVIGEYGNQVAANVDVYAGERMEQPVAPADVFDEESSHEELARQLFDEFNRFRADNNLPSLQWDSSLALVAEEHAHACAEAGRLAHVLPEAGGSVADRARQRFGWDVRYGLPGFPSRVREGGVVFIGDNLALCANPKLALFLLAESPGHRAALLNPYTDGIGIGAERRIVRRTNEILQGIYFCMVFSQINDLDVLSALQAERRLDEARTLPGGAELARARAFERKNKLAQALNSYRRFLRDNPDSTVRAEIESRVANLETHADASIKEEADRKNATRHRGMLQIALNWKRNGRTDKAIATLEELLGDCTDGPIFTEAQALMDELKLAASKSSPPR